MTHEILYSPLKLEMKNLKLSKKEFRPYSRFAERCHSETIFVGNMLRVHTALMLSVPQIRTFPLRSKKWSEAISKYILQSVNNMKLKKEATKILFCSKSFVS